ncbi:CAAX amino protease [Allostella humosa]|nr:CAAX amino protease [Stella humosa]
MAFVPAILFVGVPLAGLAAVAGRHWTALFRRYGPKALGQSLLFAILTISASLAVGLAVQQVAPVAANPVAGAIAGFAGADLPAFLARTFIQLIGEEIFTILPLLAVLWFSTHRLGLSRLWGIAVAVAVSTILFSALHLPTYDWNVVQCLGIIGTARLVLTLSYLWTRNLWVSAGAHIMNDWSIFLVAFAGSHLPAGA